MVILRLFQVNQIPIPQLQFPVCPPGIDRLERSLVSPRTCRTVSEEALKTSATAACRWTPAIAHGVLHRLALALSNHRAELQGD